MRCVFFLVFLLFASCQSPKTATVLKPSLAVDPSTTGVIRGVVSFEGKPPPPTQIPVAGFPECANPKTEDDDVLVRDGKVQNAFVYVKTGLEDYAFPEPPGEVVLDQSRCLYAPRVVGLRIG